jgi:predicted SAM-dependent methyltransferase
MRHRLVREGWNHHKVLVPASLAVQADASLRHGNHDLLLGGCPAEVIEGEALLAHFPLRTPAQYLAKVAINYLQYLAMPDRDAATGWHYRESLDLLKHDAGAFHAGFMAAARRYALPGDAAPAQETRLDPLPYQGGPLKHTPAASEACRGWQVVLRHAEDLARRNAVFAACLREDGQAALDTVAAVFERLHAQAAQHIGLLHGEYVRASQRDAALAQKDALLLTQQEQLGALQARAALLVAEIARVEQQLRRSWTWRVGRLLVAPVARVVRGAWRCRQAGGRLLRQFRVGRSGPASPLRAARRIILGAGGTSYPRWTATEQAQLDLTRREDFARHWQPGSRDAFLAEHVWEHLTDGQARCALAHCYEFLRAGGHLRIAVPDGLHPDLEYREWVRPGGNGPGADDHKVLYDYRSLRTLLEGTGFRLRLLEYWTEHGEFHRRKWSPADGHVRRSARHDSRNQEGVLKYTSLIADAIKPRARRWFRRAR